MLKGLEMILENVRFSIALTMLRQGKRITRASWNNEKWVESVMIPLRAPNKFEQVFYLVGLSWRHTFVATSAELIADDWCVFD